MGKHWDDVVEELLDQWRQRVATIEAERINTTTFSGSGEDLRLLGSLETYRVAIQELDGLLR